jgi:hypothetical protein
VQREVAGGVRDAGNDVPEQAIVRKGIDLMAQACEIARIERCQLGLYAH